MSIERVSKVVKFGVIIGCTLLVAPEVWANAGHGKYVVVVNRDNDYKASPQEMKRKLGSLYLNKSSVWSDGKKAWPAYPLQGKQEESAFLNKILKMDRLQYDQYWIGMKQKGVGARPRIIRSPTALVKFLEKYPGGVGVMKRKDALKYDGKLRILFSFD